MLGWMDGAVKRLTFIGHFTGVFWSGRGLKGAEVYSLDMAIGISVRQF